MASSYDSVKSIKSISMVPAHFFLGKLIVKEKIRVINLAKGDIANQTP